jgi:putative toxin-antitoxin system antitoxin component (TIGR02293 family)
MNKRTTLKKRPSKSSRAGKGGKQAETEVALWSESAQEPGVATVWGNPADAESPRAFKVTYGGKHRRYAIKSGFGYFIPSLRKAENLRQVNEVVENGITSAEVKDIVEYLDLKVAEVAKVASVSPSTVSRWKSNSSIGVPGSNQFFRIDELIRKGVDLFGSPAELKDWLNNPNMALGNAVPAKLLTSQIGTELVDEALEALHYGNVM